jgi:hypothetical protein
MKRSRSAEGRGQDLTFKSLPKYQILRRNPFIACPSHCNGVCKSPRRKLGPPPVLDLEAAIERPKKDINPNLLATPFLGNAKKVFTKWPSNIGFALDVAVT